MKKESNKRSFAKALTYRILSVSITFIISFIVTGKLSWATAIASLEVLTKMMLYYAHERAWAKVEWGNQDD